MSLRYVTPFNPLFSPTERPYWAYIHGGKVLHARLDPIHTHALCGVAPKPSTQWHGTSRDIIRYHDSCFLPRPSRRERHFFSHCGLELQRLRRPPEGDDHGPPLPV